MKKIIMIVGLLVVIAGAFVGGSIDPLGLRQVLGGNAEADGHAADDAHAKPAAKPVTFSYTTKERVVNLADLRYIKTEVVLDLVIPAKEAKEVAGLKGEELKKKKEHLAEEVTPDYPKISDAITTTISSKRSADLLTPEGKAALREQLKAKLDPLVGHFKVDAVHFAQFIIQ